MDQPGRPRRWHRVIKALNMTFRATAIFALLLGAWCLVLGVVSIPGLLSVALVFGLVLAGSGTLAVALELLDKRLDNHFGFEHKTLRDA